MREFKEAIRIDRCQLRGVRFIAESNRLSEEAKAWHALHCRLLEVSREMQRVSNFIWRYWVAWHTDQGSAAKVIAYMNDLRKWNTTPEKERVGTKPKCEVQAWPKEFAAAFMRQLTIAFPSVNARPLGLAVQKLMGTGKNGRGILSAFPRWMQILADEVGVRAQDVIAKAEKAI